MNRFSVVVVSTLMLVACGKEAAKSPDQLGAATRDLPDVLTVQNEGEAIEGGILNVAIVSDDPFKGIFDVNFQSNALDSSFSSFFNEPILGSDENLQWDNSGAADISYDIPNKQVTIKIKDNVNWSDGVPVKAEDFIFSYEIIGHKDYDGPRYGGALGSIVGMEEYHEGKSSTISGIEKLDDKTLRITFKEFSPSIRIAGGLWSYATPKHYMGDVPIKEMASSDKTRLKPLSFGPFILDKIVPGESVRYVKNPNYWQGEPKLDAVVAQIVPTSSIVAAMRKGQYDMVYGMPSSNYDIYKDLKNFKFIISTSRSYSYISFKVGTWDKENKRVIYNPESKMANKSLRQAMGYAIDNELVSLRFYHGLPKRANSAIIPVFKDVHDSDLKGYYYDPDKARKLLDEAGYKDLDGDGYREDPKGNQLVINYYQYGGGEVAEPVAQYRIQSWNDIGLNVQLTDGRLAEGTTYFDKLKNDYENIDVYSGGWNTGSDPSPSEFYGPKAAFNYPRWEDDLNTKLLENIDSERSLNQDYRIQAFKEWQRYFFDQAITIPTTFSRTPLPINNRVKYFNNEDGEKGTQLHQIELIANEPIKES